MDPVTMEVAEDLVDLVNTEALPLESSSTGQLVGLVLGGVVAASVFASVIFLILNKKMKNKKLITVKFNNPAFHQREPSRDIPICLQRPNNSAKVDLQSCQEMLS